MSWLLLCKRLPFDMVLVNPGSKGETGSRHPGFLARNPGGTIPTIEEPDTGFTLDEAHVIMCYLSNKHGWHDVYPTDPRQRAKVDWYLHYHHRNVRDASIGLVAPRIRKDLNLPEAILQSARNNLGRALKTLESAWLAQSRYLAGPQPTLAPKALGCPPGSAIRRLEPVVRRVGSDAVTRIQVPPGRPVSPGHWGREVRPAPWALQGLGSHPPVRAHRGGVPWQVGWREASFTVS